MRKWLRSLFGGYEHAQSAEPTGRRVLILGAGASRAQWTWQHAENLKTAPPPPPLNMDFFDIARRIDAPASDALFEQILEIRGEISSAARLTMEDGFHSVFMNVIEHPDEKNAQLIYGQYMLLIVAVIAGTTNHLCEKTSGPIDELLFYSQRAPHIGQVTVITFNYDLLVERSLAAHHTGSAANPVSAAMYKVPVTSGGVPGILSWNPKLEAFQILKPHGSLNWMIDSKYALYPSAFRNLGTCDLYLFEQSVVPLDENNRFDQWSYCSASTVPTGTLLPFLIPPTYAKDEIRLRWLDLQNELVMKAVREANEVVILGYSFPSADPMSRKIIEALKAPSEHRKVAVVDTSGRVADLLEAQLPGANIIRSTDVHDLIWSLKLTPFGDG